MFLRMTNSDNVHAEDSSATSFVNMENRKITRIILFRGDETTLVPFSYLIFVETEWTSLLFYLVVYKKQYIYSSFAPLKSCT